MYVAEPKTVQGQKGGIRVALARNAVQAQAAALFGGQRLGLESLAAVFQPAVALSAASLFRSDLRRRRCRAQEDGAVLDLFREDAVGRGRRMRTCEESMRDGWCIGCHVSLMTGVVIFRGQG